MALQLSATQPRYDWIMPLVGLAILGGVAFYIYKRWKASNLPFMEWVDFEFKNIMDRINPPAPDAT